MEKHYIMTLESHQHNKTPLVDLENTDPSLKKNVYILPYIFIGKVE